MTNAKNKHLSGKNKIIIREKQRAENDRRKKIKNKFST